MIGKDKKGAWTGGDGRCHQDLRIYDIINCAKSFAHPDWCILATPENVMRLLTLQLYFSGGCSRRPTLITPVLTGPYEIIWYTACNLNDLPRLGSPSRQDLWAQVRTAAKPYATLVWVHKHGTWESQTLLPRIISSRMLYYSNFHQFILGWFRSFKN